MSGDVQPLRRLRRLCLIAGVMPNWYETAIARQETEIGSMDDMHQAVTTWLD